MSSQILSVSQELDVLIVKHLKSPSEALKAEINQKREQLESMITEEVLNNGIIRGTNNNT